MFIQITRHTHPNIGTVPRTLMSDGVLYTVQPVCGNLKQSWLKVIICNDLCILLWRWYIYGDYLTFSFFSPTYADMPIFGQCPAQDDFYLVMCSHCSQVVKPQAFQAHYGKTWISVFPLSLSFFFLSVLLYGLICVRETNTPTSDLCLLCDNRAQERKPARERSSAFDFHFVFTVIWLIFDALLSCNALRAF